MKLTRREFLNISTAAAVVCTATLLPVEKAAAALLAQRAVVISIVGAEGVVGRFLMAREREQRGNGRSAVGGGGGDRNASVDTSPVTSQ